MCRWQAVGGYRALAICQPDIVVMVARVHGEARQLTDFTEGWVSQRPTPKAGQHAFCGNFVVFRRVVFEYMVAHTALVFVVLQPL